MIKGRPGKAWHGGLGETGFSSLDRHTVDQAPDPWRSAVTAVAIEAQSPTNVDELVRTHLPLVGHLVRELVGKLPAHVCRDDLVSAGMMALVLAARGFDATRGVPFGRFAAIRIRGALTDELRTMDWASRGVRTKAREIEAVRVSIAAQLGRTPRRDEIAQSMGVSVADLDSVDADVQRASVLSLQGLTADDADELVPSGADGPESMLMRREQIGYLRDAIAELPDRLRVVVEQYFFAERKMADIADELGVTESRVSQLRSEALAFLRDGMRTRDDSPEQVVLTSVSAGPAAAKSTSRRQTSAREAYCAAVASRSTLAHRLHATTLLGEVRPNAIAPVAEAI
jgi:RNA polymerase sigma factor FliA